jgi:hypothetical protein
MRTQYLLVQEIGALSVRRLVRKDAVRSPCLERDLARACLRGTPKEGPLMKGFLVLLLSLVSAGPGFRASAAGVGGPLRPGQRLR